MSNKMVSKLMSFVSSIILKNISFAVLSEKCQAIRKYVTVIFNNLFSSFIYERCLDVLVNFLQQPLAGNVFSLNKDSNDKSNEP